MNFTKPTYLAFFATAFASLLVAIFFEKIALLYVYPLTFVCILAIYLTEKKQTTSILFTVAILLGLVTGILLIIGFNQFVPEVSILVSLFYLIYLRLMFLKNKKTKATIKMYLRLLLIFFPIFYIYDRVICLIYSEIEEVFVYFAVMTIFMLLYIMASLYYYLRDKNQTNLWMLITAVNLGIMNIIISINELYLYERMFTVIAVFCSNFALFFSLKFMLEDNEGNLDESVVLD